MITSRHVTGEWVHVADDGMVDEDALPDEARPTGHVTFEPVWPSVATSEGSAYTLTSVPALVAEGQLRDMQGREGVWLAARVGATPVRWRAVTEVQYRGEKLPYPPVEFQLDEDLRLTARYGDMTEYPAPVVSAVESDRVAAEAAAGAAASSASDADVSAGDAAVAAGAASQSASDAAGSASAAASSAAAASGSATSADGSATDAAGAVTDARAARDAAEGHATSAAGSASDAAGSAAAADGHAGRAEAAANEFDLSVTTSTGAPGSSAAVTVSGDGPAYTLGFTVPQGAKGDKGDEGEISQAQLDAAVASLVDNAPEALNTLSELSTALGDDPNFATTVSTEIGKRALIDGAPAAYDTLGKLVTALQNHELGGSTDASLLTGALTSQVDASQATVIVDMSSVGGPSALQMPLSSFGAIYSLALQNEAALDDKSDVGHTHQVADLTTTGTASSSTYLRGDGSWATPTNTTYSVPTQAEAEAGTATTGRAFSAQRVRQAADAAITANGRLAAAPATWHWAGTTLPTAASQVHAQARVGDFIVAPNLTTDPGWHQITGV